MFRLPDPRPVRSPCQVDGVISQRWPSACRPSTCRPATGTAASGAGGAVPARPRRGGRRSPTWSPGCPSRCWAARWSAWWSTTAPTDGTADAGRRGRRRGRARWAANRGLGAAVRTGLAAAVAAGAAAVAFCDADGEYDPAELERLVAPILDGRADYVVGSRFAGQIRRDAAPAPPRQPGPHRACSGSWPGPRSPTARAATGPCRRAAAADAEIVHDYNYAQVLTLDLLAKGYRYPEVPIALPVPHHRPVLRRPLRYLRQVVPAVWREARTGAERGPPAAC